MLPSKTVTYTSQNSYSTLNSLTEETVNIWMVFHGLGYLSSYFIRHFQNLDPKKNYVIAPQAPSKYYQDKTFKHVGASWLTRVDTQMEIENVLNYTDVVYEKEVPKGRFNFIVLGYSQGVSIATRWIARRKIECQRLILHSGGIPKEIEAKDFDFLPVTTEVIYIYGDRDEYLNEAIRTEQQLLGNKLFGERLTIEVFSGIHEMYSPLVKKYALETLQI